MFQVVDRDAEDQAAMDPVITQKAFRSIFHARDTFKALFTVSRQSFGELFIYTLVPSPVGSHAELLTRCPADEMAPYAEHFWNIQRVRTANGANCVPGSSASARLSLSVAIDFASGKVLGYTTYCRYTHPEKLGEKNVFAFYHKILREVVLVVIPGPEYARNATRIVCAMGVVASFDTVCSWCGAMAGTLLRCPCKMSRYCDADCQRRHWSLHRPQCPTSKRYVDIS